MNLRTDHFMLDSYERLSRHDVNIHLKGQFMSDRRCRTSTDVNWPRFSVRGQSIKICKSAEIYCL